MNTYNIVTNYKIIQIIKSGSKYYRVNLGYSATLESNNSERVLSQKDEFAYFYNTMYRTTISGQGNIGNIKFYSDHYILEDKIAFYYSKEEFIFDFDSKLVKEKGVDFYLGHLIKEIETEYQERLKKKEEEIEIKKNIVGNPNNIIKNPGAATYEDLLAYMEKQRLERLKVK
jgi:hypothetical protein